MAGQHDGGPERPVEAKVKTTTFATIGISLVLALTDWLDDNTAALLAFLPSWLSGLLILIIPPVLVYVTGFYTNHTDRPDLDDVPEA